jgi:hypothetical protein
MTLRISLALALPSILMPVGVCAAPPEAQSFLGQLGGDWELTGTLLGKPVHYHARGRWVLQGAWLRFAMVDAASPPAYEAQLFLSYDAQADDYIAHWLDRFGAAGARVVASGPRTGDTLVLLFPYAQGAFRDTLRLTGGARGGTLLIESQAKDGSWSPFATYQMKRVGSPPPGQPPGARQ